MLPNRRSRCFASFAAIHDVCEPTIVSKLRLVCFPDQFLVLKPLANNLRNGEVESLGIVHVLPVVVTEYLFVDIPEQVEWLDGDVRSLQPALEQAPEVLASVRVDLPVDIALGVVQNWWKPINYNQN